jgi:hypothetical protein
MWTTTLATRLASAALVGVIGVGVGGTGVAAAAETSSAHNGRTANLHIMVQPSAAAPGASFTDAITVMDVGQDSADDVTITVPFDSSAVQLLGVQFNQPGAWVTSVAPNEFQAYLGGIGGLGKDVQVIASFAELPGYTPTNALPVPIAYHYSNNGQAHGGTINTELLPTEAAVAAVAQPASTSMTVTAGGTLPINSAIFAPGEAVAFWYNTPDGQSVPLYIRNGQITTEKEHQERLANGTTHERNNGAYLSADAHGTIAATLSASGLEPGAYTLVAHGLSSSATAIIAFQMQ